MHDHLSDNAGKSLWRTLSGIACMFFLAAAGYFLFTEHRAHIVPYLPYLIILLYPLMHLFHHGSPGGHHHEDHEQEDDRPSRQETEQQAADESQSGHMQETDRKDNQNQHKHRGC
jgi:Protein of unknown function (DUF2933)